MSIFFGLFSGFASVPVLHFDRQPSAEGVRCNGSSLAERAHDAAPTGQLNQQAIPIFFDPVCIVVAVRGSHHD